MSATGIAPPAYRHTALDNAMPQRAPSGFTDDPRQQTLLARMRAVNAAMLEAVLAGDGLDRVAELAGVAAGGPVALLIPRLTADPPGSESSRSGVSRPLRQWVAERVRGRSGVVPEAVLVEVPVRFRQELVGIVALLRGDEAPGAEATEFLHLAAGAAVMELAIEEAKDETEQTLRGSFLEELRSRQSLDGADLVRRASRLGCDLSRGAVILCAELTTDRPCLTVATIADEHEGAIAQELHGFGTDARPRVYAALPATVGDGSAAATLASARRIAMRLERHAIVGLSSFHADPGELDCAAQEAELMVEALHNSDMPVTDEIGGGTYALLFRMLASHPDEVRSFYEVTIAPIVRCDDQYRSDLLHTLKAYLDANCNMNATAAAIFAHRHTVAYRLDRVQDLTGLDPMLSEHRERLGLGLKIHRIIAPRVPPAEELGRQ
jgi:sugar diacid utilization regulator